MIFLFLVVTLIFFVILSVAKYLKNKNADSKNILEIFRYAQYDNVFFVIASDGEARAWQSRVFASHLQCKGIATRTFKDSLAMTEQKWIATRILQIRSQ